MNNFDIVNKVIDNLYKQSIDRPVIIPLQTVAKNRNLFVEVQTYTSLNGNGFIVIGTIRQNGETFIKIKNYGPETQREQDWVKVQETYTTILSA